MKKVLHFIFDFLKLYVLMALILALVIFVAKGTQFLGTDNSVQAIIEAITPAELFFAPFGIAFTLAITIADREKQKNDKDLKKWPVTAFKEYWTHCSCLKTVPTGTITNTTKQM